MSLVSAHTSSTLLSELMIRSFPLALNISITGDVSSTNVLNCTPHAHTRTHAHARTCTHTRTHARATHSQTHPHTGTRTHTITTKHTHTHPTSIRKHRHISKRITQYIQCALRLKPRGHRLQVRGHRLKVPGATEKFFTPAQICDSLQYHCIHSFRIGRKQDFHTHTHTHTLRLYCWFSHIVGTKRVCALN